MSGSTQTIVVVGLVGAAAVFLLRRVWASYRAARAQSRVCAADCGCEH